MDKLTPLTMDRWPELAEVLGHSFALPAERWGNFLKRIGAEDMRMVTRDGEVIAGLGFYRMGQYFGGKRVSLGGLAGVGVAPEFRGGDVAAKMVAGTLGDLRADGVSLAGLYASTQAVYRKVGFEQAGMRVRYTLPLSSIHGFRRQLPVKKAEEADLRRLYRPAHGNLDRSNALWDRVLKPLDGDAKAYTFGEEGYVAYTLGGGLHYNLELKDLCVHTPAAMATLLAFLADHRSLGENARWFGPPMEAFLGLLPEATWTIDDMDRWFIRVLHVASALGERGYAADGELHLDVDDDLFPENRGRWVLTTRDGDGVAERGGEGRLSLNVRGLAALFAGTHDAETLATMGWIRGGAAAITTAGAMFRSPVAWMREMY